MGHKPEIIVDPKQLKDYKKIILPGVGHFAKAISKLKQKEFNKYLSDYTSINSNDLFGICLGMQLLGRFSEEGMCEGLNLLNFEVRKLININNDDNIKIPNIGWRSIKILKKHFIINEIENDDFYFVHSFGAHTEDENIIVSETDYAEKFISIVGSENIIGVQFHPEKSDKSGLKLLKNFIEKN